MPSPRLVLTFIAIIAATLSSFAVERCVAQRTRANAYRRAAARGGNGDAFFEATFSGAEEDLIKSKQRDTADAIAGLLPTKSANQVARRCVELGLKCGDAHAAPERNSEQWRNLPRRE
ncbi:hypothetical protein Gpo141_00006967 [Globisporangium polare]